VQLQIKGKKKGGKKSKSKNKGGKGVGGKNISKGIRDGGRNANNAEIRERGEAVTQRKGCINSREKEKRKRGPTSETSEMNVCGNIKKKEENKLMPR